MLVFPVAHASQSACTCTPAYVTGDRTSSITVTQTTTMGGTPDPTNWVDGGFGNSASDSQYFSAVDQSGNYIRFDFGSGNSIKVTEAKFYQSNTHTHGTWKWQGSNDASAWTDIGSSFTLGGANEQTHTELGSNETGYRYYQLICESGTSGTNWLREMEFKQCTC